MVDIHNKGYTYRIYNKPELPVSGHFFRGKVIFFGIKQMGPISYLQSVPLPLENADFWMIRSNTDWFRTWIRTPNLEKQLVIFWLGNSSETPGKLNPASVQGMYQNVTWWVSQLNSLSQSICKERHMLVGVYRVCSSLVMESTCWVSSLRVFVHPINDLRIVTISRVQLSTWHWILSQEVVSSQQVSPQNVNGLWMTHLSCHLDTCIINKPIHGPDVFSELWKRGTEWQKRSLQDRSLSENSVP